MDAVKYLKERKRMCSSTNCCECPLYTRNNGKGKNCNVIEKDYAEEAVAIVEKWSTEHQAKTRQSELLNMFPNARLNYEGVIAICPKYIDKTFNKKGMCNYVSCDNCQKKYWLAEVECDSK